MSKRYVVRNFKDFRNDRVRITTAFHDGKPHMALAWPDPDDDATYHLTLLDEEDLRAVQEATPAWLAEWGEKYATSPQEGAEDA